MLRVAACQFPVTADVAANGAYVRRLLADAAARGAHLVQFPEAALSGYGGFHFPSFARYDWGLLRAETRRVQEAARSAGVFMLLGSAHRLGPRGSRRTASTSSTGGAAYRTLGIELMLHTFHNAGFPGPNVLDEYKPALIRTRAADNALWVVACNSSLRHSSWATCIARPDGSIAASLRRHVKGALVHDFPDRHLRGWLHNLRPLRLDPRTPLHNGRPSCSPRAQNGRSDP